MAAGEAAFLFHGRQEKVLTIPHIMVSVSIYTLGCKVNQLESEAIAAAFVKEGCALVPWDESAAPPGILIINTCTVTSKADQKSRRIIRKVLRENPMSCVIVTGCYAQLDAASIEALEPECGGGLPGVYSRRLFVMADRAKSAGVSKSTLLDLPGYLRDVISPNGGPGGGLEPQDRIEAWYRDMKKKAAGEGSFRFMPEDFSFHTRAFLKIQDGCDSHCTYCRVRLARGPSVSLDAARILAELQVLESKGYAELMLSGVNLTQYRDNGRSLAGLLEYLIAGSNKIALRLSSLEPEGITGELLPVLAHRRIRPHFHLSVQSGSADILKRMGRSYRPETVEQAAARLRAVRDDPFLACDIITGFPGETAAEFEKTAALCRSIGFAWIHAFPYSPRPGTPAFLFQDTVTGRDASARVETLCELAQQGRRSYTQRWAGREVETLIEQGDVTQAVPPPGIKYCRGVSENYLKLLVKYPGPEAPPPGTLLRCRIGKPPPLSAGPGGEEPHYDVEAEVTGAAQFFQ
ncbi:MAG: tRNA (N(6)-L-threonylcarbamoyladenosine(37)-C(2))-methylthiotransferase MtaB [Treponema sp.]|nr:tRNA (N(6)-L-threonylcarbamoyladenosine(37)-C(2))-methylthiotransferase MtaB [Treponema sp.]